MDSRLNNDISEFQIANNVTIAGAGLAGCLLLAALKYRWPALRVKLFSEAEDLSQTHTWSFHEGDVSPESWKWLRPYVSRSWAGYDVRFPKLERSFSSSYHSIQAQDFSKKIRDQFQNSLELGRKVDPEKQTFQTTGWPGGRNQKNYGYQKFFGLDLKFARPHGIEIPVLKDACVPQTDGYRFFYLLPWSETELLVEDTYYSNNSDLNASQLEDEVLKYVKEKLGLTAEKILRRESGALPLDLYQESGAGPGMAGAALTGNKVALKLGAAGGFVHPVTGYSLPFVVRQIQALIDVSEPSLAAWKIAHQDCSRRLARPLGFYRLLNRMMFLAADPEKRFEILQRFYGLSDELVHRFYAGETSRWDYVNILTGRPPVKISRALKVLRDQAPR